MRTSAPTSVDGIEKYLGSGMIRGIGPVYAKKMVKAFGEKVFDIIEAEPDRLREVTGVALSPMAWPLYAQVRGALVEFAGGRGRVRRAGCHPWPM